MNFEELAIALGQSDGVLFTKTELEECVALIAAHEREECAKLCEKQIEKENLLQTGDTQTLSNLLIGHRVTAHMTDARLIRARSKA